MTIQKINRKNITLLLIWRASKLLALMIDAKLKKIVIAPNVIVKFKRMEFMI